MAVIGYLGSLITAVALSFSLDRAAGLILAFAFVCWLGGWFARELHGRRLDKRP